MRTTFIGIDPGKQGAIAFIDTQDGERLFLHDIPLLPNGDINVRSIYSFLKMREPEESICFIEKAQPMPKQGVKGVFTYGCGYGCLLAILQIWGFPYQEIPSSKWKKHFSLSKDKGESIVKCLELFPTLIKDNFYTPRGRMKDGRAEALLLAEYCRRKARYDT